MRENVTNKKENKRAIRHYIWVYLKGVGMGAADVVPGVSGGTIAFITGIYEELIASIKSINFQTLKLLFKFEWKKFWQQCNFGFLLAVLLGILTSIFSLAKIVEHLLKNEPIIIWSFFFGLVLSSTIIVLRKIKGFSWKEILSFIIGVVIAYYITIATPSQTPESLWFIFICGAIAICAMILPGISGSFILVLLGKYQFILGSVNDLNIPVLIIFSFGALIGILSFSHFLSWLLKNYHNITISLLAGFMLGSLNKVWPWKQVLDTTTNSKGEIIPLIEKSIFPSTYESLGNNPQIASALLMCVAGIAIILIIEYLNTRKVKVNA